MVKQTGLGRGFGSLIPQGLDAAALVAGAAVDDGERVQQLAVGALQPNPDQPRTIFDPEALAELAASIKQYGIIQPLVVTPINGAGRNSPDRLASVTQSTYHIIAGERRWRAAKSKLFRRWCAPPKSRNGWN
jgi:ParB family chromosome partitioning protein